MNSFQACKSCSSQGSLQLAALIIVPIVLLLVLFGLIIAAGDIVVSNEKMHRFFRLLHILFSTFLIYVDGVI